MQRLSWEYIAGFFDGEGCISLAAQSYASGHYARGALTVSIAQSRERGRVVLEDIAFFIRHSIHVNVAVDRKKTAGVEPQYQLRIHGFKAGLKFIQMIQPYLRIKRVEALDIVRYNKIFPPFTPHENTIRSWEVRRQRYGSAGRMEKTDPRKARMVRLTRIRKEHHQMGEVVHYFRKDGISYNDIGKILGKNYYGSGVYMKRYEKLYLDSLAESGGSGRAVQIVT